VVIKLTQYKTTRTSSSRIPLSDRPQNFLLLFNPNC